MLRVITVKENERALLYKGGRLSGTLGPGRHWYWGFFRSLEVVKHNVVRAEVDAETAAIVAKTRPDLADQLFETVSTGEGEVAFISFDGVPAHLIGPWANRSFWKVLTDVSVETVDTKNQLRVEKEHQSLVDPDRRAMITNSILATKVIVEHQEAGLLFVDGAFVEQLTPGAHYFWSVNRRIQVVKLDLRPISHEITAQEIMTKDRVSLRLTLTAFLKVTDPVKTVQATADYETYIYRLVQFAIRDAVSNRTLDEVLNDRSSIDAQLRKHVDAHLGDIGVAVTELGVKDIILPGDMRALINKVVEAEKNAQANVIRRREETAATRSLLNTAKLMENNPLLFRLKEIEALEKLTEKVGKIEVVTGRDGAGFDSLLTQLLRSESDPNGKKEKAS